MLVVLAEGSRKIKHQLVIRHNWMRLREENEKDCSSLVPFDVLVFN